MPRDTVWINEFEYFVTKDINDTSVIYIEQLDSFTKKSYDLKKKSDKFIYDKDKAYYDSFVPKFGILIFLAFLFFCYHSIKIARHRKKNPFDDYSDWVEIGNDSDDYYEAPPWKVAQKNARPAPIYLTYYGKDLKFTTDQIVTVLKKRFPFYNSLSLEHKSRFIKRLNIFLKSKIFRIHDKSGFNDMPILISASAIQLSFELEEYLLPKFKNIHIFPKEFLGLQPTMRFLVGNVSNNRINISWKHLLEGYSNINDGHNVALHEFAHAYYLQYIVDEKDSKIYNAYQNFVLLQNTTTSLDLIHAEKMFTSNATSNEYEFWAESVELYFEKSEELKKIFPDLYDALKLILNPR